MILTLFPAFQRSNILKRFLPDEIRLDCFSFTVSIAAFTGGGLTA